MAGTKGKATQKNIDTAFEVYRSTGGIKSATIKMLKKEHGLSITRDTLYTWIKENNFDERRKEIDAQRLADQVATVSAWARAVKGLLKVTKKYEAYMDSDAFFNAKGKPNDMAVFAYAAVTSQLRLFLRKLDYIKDDERAADDVKKIAKGITDSVADDIREKILGVEK